jgi:hypothetical protein
MAKKGRTEIVRLARAAFIVAALRRLLMTYKELGVAIGVGGVALRNEIRHVLDELSEQCISAREPSLVALVVNAQTGAPGEGWTDGSKPWHAEVQQNFRYWAKRSGASDR